MEKDGQVLAKDRNVAISVVRDIVDQMGKERQPLIALRVAAPAAVFTAGFACVNILLQSNMLNNALLKIASVLLLCYLSDKTDTILAERLHRKRNIIKVAREFQSQVIHNKHTPAIPKNPLATFEQVANDMNPYLSKKDRTKGVLRLCLISAGIFYGVVTTVNVVPEDKINEVKHRTLDYIFPSRQKGLKNAPKVCIL